MTYQPTQADKEAMKLVNNEITAWADEEVFITDKISFVLRNVIKRARKNYFGIFNEPKDSATKQKKLFFPLTESMCNAVRNFIDLDTKDINLRAKNIKGADGARIIRHILYSKMIEWGFGEKLNEMLTYLPIDGIAYFKSWRNGNKVEMYIPDALNMYQDPAKKAGELPLIERIIMSEAELQDMKGIWENTEAVKFTKEFETFEDGASRRSGELNHVILYERWGEMSKYLITGKEKDRKVIIKNGHIVKTGADQTAVCLLAEEKESPYEAVSSTFVPNRYLGRGSAEKLFDIQEYLNETLNIRRNKGKISQNLLWHIRKGSGITRQMVAALRGGGAIVSKSKDDITNIPIRDFSPSSYQDESSALAWAQRVSNFSPQVMGEQLPSSTPATTSLIQQRTSENTFSIVKEDVGLFLKRVFEKHLIPLMIETLTDGEIVRITGEPKDLEKLDKIYIDKIVDKEIIKIYQRTGQTPDDTMIEQYKQSKLEQMAKKGDLRWVKINKRLLKEMKNGVDADVFITNEAFDKSVVVKQLNDLLLTYSRIPGINLPVEDIMKATLDIMGLKDIHIQAGQPTVVSPEMAQQRGIDRPTATPGEVANQSSPTQLGEIEKASKLNI